MRALLLAAGFGTRLRPLTERVPKCLVPVGGTPLLQIWLQRLSMAGVGPYLANTHHLAAQVESFVRTSDLARRVTLVHEKSLLGTAGTLIANLDFFQDGDGMLIHADNYCLADFKAFLSAHESRPRNCLITMMTFRTPTPSTCGIVELDDRGVVQAFHEKVAHPPGNLANGAVYLLSREFLRLMATDLQHVTDFSTQVLGRFVGRIYSYETSEPFIDIGTPEALAAANAAAAATARS